MPYGHVLQLQLTTSTRIDLPRSTIILQAKIEARLQSRESTQENLSQSDEEFFQKAFRAYCLSEIHLHHMVSIELVTVSSKGLKGRNCP